MKKYNSIKNHFLSIEPVAAHVKICNKIFPIKVWQLFDHDVAAFAKVEEFKSLEEFESKMGSVKNWQPVVLITKLQLDKFYKDSSTYSTDQHHFYIVEPTSEFKSLDDSKKPEVYNDYLIQDEYAVLKDKLPELKGIF